LLFEIALKRVDFPTFGKPTIPHFKPMISFFIKSGRKYKRSGQMRQVWKACKKEKPRFSPRQFPI
jgi:hypothetical protein